MTGQNQKTAIRRASNYEVSTEYSDKESLLYGREEDYSQGADAPFRGMPAAEGVRIHQFMEQRFL